MCAHIYLWHVNGSVSFYYVASFFQVSSLSLVAYYSLVISETNKFMIITHI